MSHETIVYGIIDAGEFENELGENPHHPLNVKVLETLPETDERPALTRDMFSIAARPDGFGSQIIHFAATYQALEKDWEAWLEKFEAFLGKLHWYGATVHLESELFEGDYRYEWCITEEAMDRCFYNDLLPVDEFEFDGGPRRFDY